MKKITAIVMVVIMMAAIVVPSVMAAESPERNVPVVATKDDLPEATAESPDFVFVTDEGIIYVKDVDQETGEYFYRPETEDGTAYYDVTPKNQVWYKGSGETLTFTSTASFDKFVGVLVDGVEIAAENYDAVEGSTKVTLKNAYLETLEVGNHTITIVSNDGTGTIGFEVKASQSPEPVNPDTPKTGDESKTGLWVAIALITLGAIGVVALTLVKTRKTTDK